MTRRLALAIGLAVLIIFMTATFGIHTAMARPLTEPDSYSGMQYKDYRGIPTVTNMHAVDEGNLTFPSDFRVKHRFFNDYPNGSPDFGVSASDTTDSSGISTIPEFPSFIIILLFMATSLLGVTLFKRHVKKS